MPDILYTTLSETTLTEDTDLDAGTLDCHTLNVIDLAGHKLTLTGVLGIESSASLVVKDSAGTGQVDASQMQCSNLRQPAIEQEDKDVSFIAAVFAISFRNIVLDQDAQGNPRCGLDIIVRISDDGKCTTLSYEYRSVTAAAEAYPELLKEYLFDPDALGSGCPEPIEGLEITIDLTGMPTKRRGEGEGGIFLGIARGMTIHFVGTLHYEGGTIKPEYMHVEKPADSSEYATIDLSGLTVTVSEGVGRDYNGEIFWFGDDMKWIKPDNMDNLTTDGIKLFSIFDVR